MPSHYFYPISAWATDSVNTGATGANFVPLNSHNCDEVTIINPGVGLDIQSVNQDANGNFVSIAANSGITIQVVANSLEVLIRRTDKSNTASAVQYIWRKYK
jgi:hypothetical protein